VAHTKEKVILLEKYERRAPLVRSRRDERVLLKRALKRQKERMSDEVV
jgi:hypothetical protein